MTADKTMQENYRNAFQDEQRHCGDKIRDEEVQEGTNDSKQEAAVNIRRL